MTLVTSFAGQKGGVGKSMLCQAFGVMQVRAGRTVTIVDLDIHQRSSFEWGEARRLNGIAPAVNVVVVDPDERQDFGFGRLLGRSEHLLVDAPGWPDERTLILAGYSNLLVLPTGPSTTDMRPAVRLMHALTDNGIDQRRIVTALVRVETESEIKAARAYIAEAGYATLPGVLRELPSFRQLQDEGRTPIESEVERDRLEAHELLVSIATALERVQEIGRSLDDEQERFVFKDR